MGALKKGIVNFPRRQQYRRLRRAIATILGAVVAAGLAVLAVSLGSFRLALVLLAGAVALGLYARHWGRLAGRSRVGARSEGQVQRALAPLTAEGWQLRHSLPWQGRGDIDSIAIAPTGIAIAIETKSRTFDDQHLDRVHEMALWLHARRRRWCPAGALPVVCVVHARQLERTEAGVMIVSLDRLLAALRRAAGTLERPAFLARPHRVNKAVG
ncbi:MAG TPA: nuclease-related domain-containing protein [Solirubrobacteraceae bacterium]